MNLFFTIGFKGKTRAADAVPLYAGRDKAAADAAGVVAVEAGEVTFAQRFLAPAFGKIHKHSAPPELVALEEPEAETGAPSLEAVLADREALIEKLTRQLAAAEAAALVVPGPEIDAPPVIVESAEPEATTAPVVEEAAAVEQAPAPDGGELPLPDASNRSTRRSK